MAITKDVSKGPAVRISKATQGPHSKNMRGPAPKAMKGGAARKGMGTRVNAPRKGAMTTGR